MDGDVDAGWRRHSRTTEEEVPVKFVLIRLRWHAAAIQDN